jgi:hypothetical protein
MSELEKIELFYDQLQEFLKQRKAEDIRLHKEQIEKKSQQSKEITTLIDEQIQKYGFSQTMSALQESIMSRNIENDLNSVEKQ